MSNMLGRIDEIQAQVDWRIAPFDYLFDQNDPIDGTLGPRGYAGVGASALRILIAALLSANRPAPASLLDFGCACGRITRWMRSAFPQADLHVSDIVTAQMEWTAETFGAKCWPSASDFGALKAPQKVDMIWSGSVATHISETDTVSLIEHFYEWLNPLGIAVVSTHGRQFVDFAQSGLVKYFAGPGELETILAGMISTGYGYAPHPGQTQGISGNTSDWLIRTVRRLGARVILYGEHLYDNHQDVIAFQKI